MAIGSKTDAAHNIPNKMKYQCEDDQHKSTKMAHGKTKGK
jgi:hypothetical protein